jgi:pimeloyl-ACP methyl ester carboxylesterase
MTTEEVQKIEAGRLRGELRRGDAENPLVLLHGMSFDSTMWGPLLEELRSRDPRRTTLTLDLPGHGRSDPWPSYELERVTDAVHDAVESTGLKQPVLVGHSVSGIIATIYAAHHYVAGVVNVDQPLDTLSFLHALHSLRPALLGEGFEDAWRMIWQGMQVDRLPDARRSLLEVGRHPEPSLVRAWWREALDRIPEEVQGWTEGVIHGVSTKEVPYLIVFGSEPGDPVRTWLADRLPQVRIEVMPGSGHFPHLAHPKEFAKVLVATGTCSAARTAAAAGD